VNIQTILADSPAEIPGLIGRITLYVIVGILIVWAILKIFKNDKSG
jgi:hypothetical protein